MANDRETTFEQFQTDERFKKLKRSLKLAMLRRTHSDDGGMSVGINQPSISSINVDSLDSSCVIPSLQTSVIKSEILASSNNLRNLVLTKRNYKANQGIMITSSVKQDDYLNDQCIMPPPRRNTVYRTPKETQNKVPTLSNYGTAASNLLNRSIQSSTVNNLSLENAPSCISRASPSSNTVSNTDTNKVYNHSLVAPIKCTNDIPIIERIFLKWKVMLNDYYELIIKGTLECGRVARSKPVIRRYSATCVESKYKHIYNLKGNIVDERNVLPDYIRGKFYNGFPDDWENVYQIWRTYVSQGCPVTFRWPTPITDSDDDLKSEITELTYIRTTNNKTMPIKTYNTTECINSENPSNTSSKNEEKRNCSSHSFQRCEENTLFVKPLVSNSKKDITPIPQTRNIELARDEDKQNIDLNVNPLLPEISFIVMNKLKDIIREDKLRIIINNLADKNCSPKYIDKIIELFKCSDYIVSYRAKSECNDDSAVFMNCGTSSKFETIPLQSSLSCNDNSTNINKVENINVNKFENNMEQSKNYMRSTDLRCGSIRNDCNSIQSSNSINIKQQQDNNNDSDESESETYGVPKISEIDRILHAQKAFKKMYKHKVRKKSTNSQCNAKEIEHKFTHANPITNNNRSVFDESDISITEDETKARKRYERMNIAQKSREDTFYRNSGIRKNNFDVHGTNKPVVQNEQSLDTLEAQRVNLNVFVKEQKAPHRVQENAHSQFVTDIDYTTISDIDVNTNKQKKDENMRGLHSNLDQKIVINSNSNSDFENSSVLRESCREFIEQPKSETMRAKPNIISSLPVNLKLKIKQIDSKLEQFKREQAEQVSSSDVIIVENEERKQYSNIQPSEEIQKKKSVSKTSSQTVANDKICPTTNKENESNINPTNLKSTMMMNPTIEQSKNNELKVENNRKVLCAWVPKVIYYAKSKFELGLIFEGKLLNEAGHVVHRKFMTDIILKRLSPMLIETVNHEFYELSGHLKDNKHVIPKELAKQCRNGCPANIEQFCLTWKRLQNCKIQEMNEKPHNTAMNSLNTSISSRGRRIIPSLSYWTGERITLKDNNLVYNPGSSQESSLHSLIETSIEALNAEETEKANSKNTSKEQKFLLNSNEIPSTNKNPTIVTETIQASNKSPKTEATKRSYKLSKSQKSRIKRRMKRNLISSTDSSEEEYKVPPPKRMHTQLNTETPSQYTMTLRKRYDRGIP